MRRLRKLMSVLAAASPRAVVGNRSAWASAELLAFRDKMKLVC